MTECAICLGTGLCEECQGDGIDEDIEDCEECDGTGICQICDGSGEE